jgi:hypothetical protein
MLTKELYGCWRRNGLCQLLIVLVRKEIVSVTAIVQNALSITRQRMNCLIVQGEQSRPGFGRAQLQMLFLISNACWRGNKEIEKYALPSD